MQQYGTLSYFIKIPKGTPLVRDGRISSELAQITLEVVSRIFIVQACDSLNDTDSPEYKELIQKRNSIAINILHMIGCEQDPWREYYHIQAYNKLHHDALVTPSFVAPFVFKATIKVSNQVITITNLNAKKD